MKQIMKAELGATDFLEIIWSFDWNKKKMLAERNEKKKSQTGRRHTEGG